MICVQWVAWHQVTLRDDLWPHLVELILSEGDVFLCGCHLQFVDLGLEVYFRQSNFKYMYMSMHVPPSNALFSVAVNTYIKID